MDRVPARFLAAGIAAVLLALPTLVIGAELRLRESLLVQQRDRVTATVTAVVDHIGNEAHALSDDCDLHVPLRSREIRVAFFPWWNTEHHHAGRGLLTPADVHHGFAEQRVAARANVLAAAHAAHPERFPASPPPPLTRPLGD